MKISIVPMLLALSVTLACGGSGSNNSSDSGTNSAATVRGHVSDGAGSQSQQALTFGGSGTISATVKVTASTVSANGSLSAVADAEVSDGGVYELTAPESTKRLVLQAMDSSGNVVASGILEASGTAGAPTAAAPMNTETSVEAQVFVAMATQGVAVSAINVIDLRTRIDEETAAAAQASAGISALAQATIAAQATQIAQLAKAGISTSQSALFDAQLSAALTLDASLDASSTASGDATASYETFYAAIAANWQSLGADAQKSAQTETAASATFDATLEAKMAGNATLLDASLRASGVLRARADAAALNAAAAGSSQAAVTHASTVSAQLVTSAKAATTAAATAQAFTSFSASITGTSTVNGSVVGDVLSVNASTILAAQATVTTSAQAAAALKQSLAAVFSAGLSASGSIDVTTLSNEVATAYATDQSTAATTASLSVFGSQATAGAQILILASLATSSN